MYPVSEVWRPISFAAPPPHPSLTRQLPAIELVRSEALPAAGAAAAAAGHQACSALDPTKGGGSCAIRDSPRQRLHLELRLQSMGWGVLNVTGPLLAWSFTDALPTAPVPHVRPFLHEALNAGVVTRAPLCEQTLYDVELSPGQR